MPSKVIQRYLFWDQSKACMRFPISDYKLTWHRF